MTYDFLGQAIKFRQSYDQPIGQFNIDQLDLQMDLIREEYLEFDEAYEKVVVDVLNKHSREEALKELADLVYVCFQFAAAAGWELDEALDRVHKSNMSKLVDGKPIKNEAGKVMKGPNYQYPYLDDLV